MDHQDQNSDSTPVPAVPSTPLPSNPPVATAITSQVLAAQPDQPQKHIMQRYNRLGLGIYLAFVILILLNLFFFGGNIVGVLIVSNIFFFAVPVLFFINIFIIGYLNAFSTKTIVTRVKDGLPGSTAAPSNVASPSIVSRITKIEIVLAYVVLIFASLSILTLIQRLFYRVTFAFEPLFGVSPVLTRQVRSVAELILGVVAISALTLLFARLGRRYALKSSNQTTKRKSIGIKAIIGILIIYIVLLAVSLIINFAESNKEGQSSDASLTFCERFFGINIATAESQIGELSANWVIGETNTKKVWNTHVKEVQALIDAAPAELRDNSAAYLRMVKAQAELRTKYGYIDTSEYPAGVYDKFEIDHDQDSQQSGKFYDGVVKYCDKDPSSDY